MKISFSCFQIWVALAVLTAGASLFPLKAHAGFGDFFQKLGFNSPAPLTDSKIAAGLKEALQVGIDKTVALTGRKDGYFSNSAIKILMPEKVQRAEGLIRKMGLGPQVDEFILSMNRAAEKAAPEAKDIFINAIKGMTFEDVKQILHGGDTAATDYFKVKTHQHLIEAYGPAVNASMKEYAVTGKYQQLTSKIANIPMVGPAAKKLDVESYVVGKALDGLFLTLADQEQLIRKDPAARVTSLLKEVFST